MSPPPPGLNDIDAQIAALEAKLGGAVASGSSDEDADDARHVVADACDRDREVRFGQSNVLLPVKK